MRTTIILVLLTLCMANAAAASEARAPSSTHVRPLTTGATALLAEATDLSAIIRMQVQQLEKSDVVVFLSDSISSSTGEPRASLVFMSYVAGTRYLVVQIDRWKHLPADRIASLGHELQHALEVAAAPDVKNSDGLARLYRQIGWEGKTGRFESDGAVATGRRVRNQLAGFE
jgi:hypothetical protein